MTKGVNLIAMACAWSNNDVAYCISTFGNTSSCKDYCIGHEANTSFDGVNDTKSIPRPDLHDILFRLLPSIDSINNQRQYGLQLETNWPTKSCWTKLLVAFMGHSVVNHQRIMSYKYPGIPGKDMTILDTATSIAAGKTLKRIKRKILPRPLRQSAVKAVPLKRLSNANGIATKQITKKQRTGGRNVGTSIQLTCFICKKYQSKYSYTSSCCPKCGTAVCMKDRGRPLSCYLEHLNTGDDNIRCNGIKRTVFPATSRSTHFDQKDE